MIRNGTRDSAALCFNSHCYRTYCQQYGINCNQYLVVLNSFLARKDSIIALRVVSHTYYVFRFKVLLTAHCDISV